MASGGPIRRCNVPSQLSKFLPTIAIDAGSAVVFFCCTLSQFLSLPSHLHQRANLNLLSWFINLHFILSSSHFNHLIAAWLAFLPKYREAIAEMASNSALRSPRVAQNRYFYSLCVDYIAFCFKFASGYSS